MLVSKHIIISFFICIPLFFIYNWWTLLIFISAILIDFDHYAHYVIKFKKLNLKKAYLYYKSRNERSKKVLLIFHTWEVLAALLILSFFNQIFWFIFLGFFIHMLEDLYDFYFRVKFYKRRISLFFDI